MSDRKPWSEVRDARIAMDGDPEGYEEARQALEAELDAEQRTLRDVRRARALTQAQLAASLRVSQAQVSRIESQADLYLSTLRSYVEAMGGELELRVVFGDGAWAELSLGAGGEAFGSGEQIVVVEEGEFREIAKGVYVVPRADGWAVRRAGRTRASAVLGTEAEAIDRACEMVRTTGGQVVVQRAAS